MEDRGTGGRQPRLLDQLRATLRRLHYSHRTEEAYVGWALRYVRFHGRRHPRELGHADLMGFLNHLACEARVAASSQNQALCAIVFLYRRVLGIDIEGDGVFERARRSRGLPVVLSPPEVRSLLAELKQPYRLMAELMYGSGLRLSECVSLRVKDIDFAGRQIVVRQGKGAQDRVTLLPDAVVEPLRRQVARIGEEHRADVEAGFGRVDLPSALERKIPTAATSLPWQYLFPSSCRCTDPHTGAQVRHHIDESALQRAVKAAADSSGLTKRATCHNSRTRAPRISCKRGRASARSTHLVGRGPLGTEIPPGYPGR